MTEFISRNHAQSNYEIIIKTDDPEHWKATVEFARRLIGHAKPMTNADRIRAMTDEELANFLSGMSACGVDCPACDYCQVAATVSCLMSTLEWLQQPVKEDAE